MFECGMCLSSKVNYRFQRKDAYDFYYKCKAGCDELRDICIKEVAGFHVSYSY